MSEKQDRPSERLEALLRQWGVDEAAQTAKAHLAPSPAPPTPRSVLLRWAPAAAAAVLFIAAGTSYMLWRLGSSQDQAAGDRPLAVAPEATTFPRKRAEISF